MDVSADSPADGRWMTLKELADARRISVASAARLMRRRRWRRQPGNDGHIRVLVPAGEQEPKADDRPDRRPDVTTEGRPDVLADIRADVMEVIRPLQNAIAVLEAQLTEANARAVRAEQAVAGERVRADVLRDKLESLQAELRKAEETAVRLTDAEEAAKRAIGEAEEAAQALDQIRRAEEARKARGRLRRAWDGWRGR